MTFLLSDIHKQANILFVKRLCVIFIFVFAILLGLGIEPYTACANVQSQCRFHALSDLPHRQDGWNLLAELNAPSSLLRAHMWGLDLSASGLEGLRAGSGTEKGDGGVGGLLFIGDWTSGIGYSHAVACDGIGNVMALLHAPIFELQAVYEYGPFGELIRATGPMSKINAIRFSTKYTDDESGFLYYGHRYYDPSTGKWINRDPIEEMGGMNLYGFIKNEVLSTYDILGLADRCGCARIPKNVTVDVDELAKGAGTTAGVAQIINKQLNEPTKECIKTPAISAHGDPIGFSLTGDMSIPMNTSGKLSQANAISQDNAEEIFKKYNRLFCFCKPCDVWLLSCQVGLSDSVGQQIANATGCTVHALLGNVHPNLSNSEKSPVYYTIPGWFWTIIPSCLAWKEYYSN